MIHKTEQAAKDYIAANKHNLGETRIYAASLYRNDEMLAIRQHLIDLGDESCTGKACELLKQLSG